MSDPRTYSLPVLIMKCVTPRPDLRPFFSFVLCKGLTPSLLLIVRPGPGSITLAYPVILPSYYKVVLQFLTMQR
jgi:hypothetical protein